MSYSDKEKDDFWDIDKLLPKKRTAIPAFSENSKVFVHSISGEEGESTSERRLTVKPEIKRVEPEEITYQREDNSLIRSVTIRKNVDKYDFYGNFRKAALIYHDYRTPKCEFEPYYSYMPQYSQLSPRQKGYYFYWREEVRRGRYIKSDYSYLYLYVYEILNLPDKIPPEEGIIILARLWREYRAALPRIDSYFSVWVQDYCLLYNLPLPREELGGFVYDIISAASFKEFYLSEIGDMSREAADAMLAYLSDYDPRRARFAIGENARIYRQHLTEVMGLLLKEIYRSGVINDSSSKSTLTRDAFPHSLLTHAVKSRLTVEYISLSENYELRHRVTSALRYTDNKLRALFGVKSRLAVKDITYEHKQLIDLYFDSMIAEQRERKRRESLPEYEKLYDAPSVPLSFAGADEIERASWETTYRLVAEETEPMDKCKTDDKSAEIIKNDYEFTTDYIPVTDSTAEAAPLPPDNYGLSTNDIMLIRLALDGNTTGIDDSAMERINEAFADGFGDVILESDGIGYTVIEDYKEEIREWLNQTK